MARLRALGPLPRSLPAAPLLWLRDATPVRIRAVRADDLERERSFCDGLSPQTRYLRLMSGRGLLPGELERWTAIDPLREIALVAVAARDGRDEQLGVARCVRDADDPTACDFAIVVADRVQHQGLGEALLRTLMRAAADAGIARFAGITLSENRGMLALARRLGLRIRRDAGDATVTRLEADLAPGGGSLDRGRGAAVSSGTEGTVP